MNAVLANIESIGRDRRMDMMDNASKSSAVKENCYGLYGMAGEPEEHIRMYSFISFCS